MLADFYIFFYSSRRASVRDRETFLFFVKFTFKSWNEDDGENAVLDFLNTYIRFNRTYGLLLP